MRKLVEAFLADTANLRRRLDQFATNQLQPVPFDHDGLFLYWLEHDAPTLPGHAEAGVGQEP
jgi:hypothetical protein